MSPSLTERDDDMLFTLARPVRALSVPQIARTYFSAAENPERATRLRLRKLAADDWVQIVVMTAQPETPLATPLATWAPGQSEPDLSHVARILQTRWREPVEQIDAVVATVKTARRYGGVGERIPRRSEATHDIHLAQLYLKFRAEAPERAAGWIGEDIISAQRKTQAERAQPLPDALIVEGNKSTIIEMGGSSYTSDKLYLLHDYSAREAMPYEIW